LSLQTVSYLSYIETLTTISMLCYTIELT